ncbi:MAG: hypothetical protein KF726_23815 [Anaerolineae bacterium]|nr:hypothetical protein [Anaerolineae bacterium]
MKPIIVLTGPAASGKNTIGHLYATRFCQRGVVIDGDVVRQMLRQPHHAPWDGTEGLAQHRLGVHHNCLLAHSFYLQDCDVIVLDVLWMNLAAQYRAELAPHPLCIVRLLPTWEEVLRRLHSRPPSITDDEARWTYDQQLQLDSADHTLENSTLSPEDCAQWIANLP